ncbi:MAG: choice-of-anchor D domain-containing protein [Bacteroidetes bacterium]|nr:choice-of-anchor D domain-containing protein [Bacteroidota bacterium]
MHCCAKAVLTAGVLIFCGYAASGQVQARNAAAPQLPPPVLLAPSSGSEDVTIRPQFQWHSVSGSAFYVLQIALDTLFSDSIQYSTPGGDTLLRAENPLRNGTLYYWRVGAAAEDSAVSFAPAGHFRTRHAPTSGRIYLSDSRRNESTPAFAILRNDSHIPITVDSLSGHPHVSSGSILPTVLGAHDSLLVQYRYHPRAFGVEADTVTLFTDGGECRVPLAAACSPPLLVAGASEALLGPVALTDSASTTLVFMNGGPFNKLTVKRVWTGTQFFSASFLPIRTIEPGDSLRVPVRFHLRSFKHDAFGSYADTCYVESDGGFGRVLLRGESPSPRAFLEPAVLSFGEVAAGDTAYATLRVMNLSVNTLRIDSVRNKRKTFHAMSNRLRVGRSDTVLVSFRFTPAQFGVHTDTVVLHNTSWRGPLAVPMVGITPYPRLEAGVDRLDFASVERGDTASAEIRIANSSVSTLRLDSVRTGTRAFRLSPPDLPASVRKGDTLRVSLIFFPDSIRHFSDTLYIVSNAAGSPHRIPLRGDGIPPGIVTGRGGLPGEFELFQNYPNPFNGTTTFRYALPEPSHVRLEVFTTLGQHVALLVDAEQQGGFYNVSWTAGATSGVYYYRLLATPRSNPGKRYSGTRKMVLMR